MSNQELPKEETSQSFNTSEKEQKEHQATNSTNSLIKQCIKGRGEISKRRVRFRLFSRPLLKNKEYYIKEIDKINSVYKHPEIRKFIAVKNKEPIKKYLSSIASLSKLYENDFGDK